ncbi:hypothetical protein HELRODRAFT_80663 [Helobdella robusta]|uniref:General transcription and DNA repair factor IIH subunit TFB5 n=1 Tax=Helobdella robusta TaxID=6412 RepID=T1G436_HELRO|nr:hypothetical protein HELRODRAFT_80663 [Helobdella robusta]ESO03177.1 hypothetical protein HELRODRAFT_80663 [Helobdella robusta]
MVYVLKGVLVECDPPMKQLLLKLNETKALGETFVLSDLDDSHLFIDSRFVKALQDKIDETMDKIHFPLEASNLESFN